MEGGELWMDPGETVMIRVTAVMFHKAPTIGEQKAHAETAAGRIITLHLCMFKLHAATCHCLKVQDKLLIKLAFLLHQRW